MLKSILFAVYIAFVLALSGSVKADSQSLGLVQQVELNPATGVIVVHGALPTPCAIRPTLAVNQIDQTAHEISLEVVTTETSGLCIEVLGGNFDASLDLKDLPLVAGETYSIVIENSLNPHRFIYVAKAQDETLRAYKLDRRALKGYLVSLSDPANSNMTTLALKSGNELIPVASPDMPLDQFRNSNVWMDGYVISTASLNNMNDPLAQSSQVQMVIVPVAVSH